MGIAALMAFALALVAPSAGAETCAAKPFTLNKPAAAQPPAKPVAKPSSKTAAASAKPVASKPAPKPIADCNSRRRGSR